MPRTGGSFRGLVSYLTGDLGKTERVGQIRLGNCVSADVASAVLEVENAQARNSRARHTTYHLVLSFREQPPGDVLQAIEQRTCAELGFADHHRVSVVHHDTEHLHLHIAISRVHPTTHRAHWPSHSKLALDRLCVELEQQYGLKPDRHLARERGARLRGAEGFKRRPPDMERVSGFESLIGFVQRQCAERFRAARSWPELHQIAESHGLRVQLRGNGIVFGVDAGAVKGSSIARDLSKAALELRLGAFQESAIAAAAVRVSYQKRPLDPGAPALYERYLREREAASDRRNRAIARLAEQRGQEGERLQVRSERRWTAIRLVAKGRLAWMLWRAYARHAARRDRERASEQRRRAVRAAAAELRPLSWPEWLRDCAAQGDQEALAALRRRSRRADLTPSAIDRPERNRARPQPTQPAVQSTGVRQASATVAVQPGRGRSMR